jgi:hypothetical protein
VTGNPADISRAPINVAIVVIENQLVCHRGIEDVTAGGVQHAFWFASGTRGIEDEQRILGAFSGFLHKYLSESEGFFHRSCPMLSSRKGN